MHRGLRGAAAARNKRSVRSAQRKIPMLFFFSYQQRSTIQIKCTIIYTLPVQFSVRVSMVPCVYQLASYTTKW